MATDSFSFFNGEETKNEGDFLDTSCGLWSHYNASKSLQWRMR